MLSALAAARLKPRLDAFLAGFDSRARIAFDPVEFPRRYRDPDDVEVAALFSASLAYGRADLFRPKLARLFADMDDRPGAFVRDFDPARDLSPFRGFVYRFNVGADLAVLAAFASVAMRRDGSLGAAFARHFARVGEVRGALSGLAEDLAAVNRRPIERRLGQVRGLGHLFPDPARGGACKRQMLWLRWMVRGPDGIDFGLWRSVPRSALVIPLDTHVARVARRLGLTARRTLGWRTAEEITASLRRLDPEDPVKYDFALCHYGMSGACPPEPTLANCRPCLLAASCRSGAPRLRRAARSRDGGTGAATAGASPA